MAKRILSTAPVEIDVLHRFFQERFPNHSLAGGSDSPVKTIFINREQPNKVKVNFEILEELLKNGFVKHAQENGFKVYTPPYVKDAVHNLGEGYTKELCLTNKDGKHFYVHLEDTSSETQRIVIGETASKR